MKTEKKQIISQTLIVLTCLFIAASILYTNYSFFHDDAYITMRYAKNFLDGKGIVWNEGERIQGYSNFLFLLFISALGSLGVNLKTAAQIISFLSFLTLLISVFYFPRKLNKNNRKQLLDLLPFILVSTSSPLLVWIWGGLEGVFLTALSTLAVLTLLTAFTESDNGYSYFIISGTLFSFSALARPDAVVFLFISLFLFVFFKKKSDLKKFLYFIIPCFSIFTIYGIWAMTYYGNILPNTFYAKATNFTLQKVLTGGSYLLKYIIAPPYLILFVIAVAIYAVFKKQFELIHSYLSSLILLFLIYIIYVGGDQMPASRFILPVIPIASLLFYFLLKKIVGPAEYWKNLFICTSMIILSFFQLYIPYFNPKTESQASYFGTIGGKYIAGYLPENSLIALNTAGSTPYFAPNNRYIDMLGLNDYHIARRVIKNYELPRQKMPGHLKGDGEYVLSRKPDFIIIGPAQGTTIDKPWFLSDLEISRNKDFSNDYIMNKVNLNKDGVIVKKGGTIFTYYSRVNPGFNQ